jgi:hypothetical protein
MITQSDLRQFTGTETWTRYAPFGGKGMLLTDGAKFLAEEAGAFWLLDIILSIKPKYFNGDDWFKVVKLAVKDHNAVFTLEDGNDNILYRQEIPYTDFPFAEQTLFVQTDGIEWTIMLPSEY